MGSRNVWLPAALSLSAHGALFAVMPSAIPTAQRTIALVRVEHTPAPKPIAPPPSEVEAQKIEPRREIPRRVERPKARAADPKPTETKPEPAARPAPADGERRVEAEVAAPGPAEAEHGDGPAAGNGPMLGGGTPTTNVAKGGETEDAQRHAAGEHATRDLAGYERGVGARVNARRRYPAAARRLGLEGRAVVALRLDRAGRITDKRLVESTKHAILDEEALRIVEAAAPYPPLPDTWQPDSAEFLIPIRFQLQ